MLVFAEQLCSNWTNCQRRGRLPNFNTNTKATKKKSKLKVAIKIRNKISAIVGLVFLPRHLLKHSNKYVGKDAQIVAFLALSESPGDKAKSRQNAGVCRAVML